MARDKRTLELRFKLCIVDMSSKRESKGYNPLRPSNQGVFFLPLSHSQLLLTS